jgi:hypothetical protein
LPDRYGVTPTYWRLRVAERFGLDPRQALYQMPDELGALLDAYEHVRVAEEVREKSEGFKATYEAADASASLILAGMGVKVRPRSG